MESNYLQIAVSDGFIVVRRVGRDMPETVLFESESDQSREQIASYLRTVADTLDAGRPLTLRAGGESVSLDPPARSTFEVKAEREGPTNGPGELSVEFELEWDEGGHGSGQADGQLQIE